MKRFRAHSVFQGKRKLLKKPECKKYIPYSEFKATLFFRASASCSKILNVKSIFNTLKNFRTHAVFQGKRKLLRNPEWKKYIPYSEKFQGTLCFQGKRKLLKKPECKKYIPYSEFKATLSFRANASCSKILNVKSIFNTVKNDRAHSVFQGKRKLLKKPECKKYIPYSEFKATLFFRASAKLLRNPECKKYIQYSKKLQDTRCF